MHTCTDTWEHTYMYIRTNIYTQMSCLQCLITAQHGSCGLPKREGRETARVGHHITRFTGSGHGACATVQKPEDQQQHAS